MSPSIRVTALVENSVHLPGLRGEHGLSFHLTTGEKSILFDTGQSDLLYHNASHLGIALDKIDAVVLSHGHYDHTSGLEFVLQHSPKAKLFMHPMASAPKFVREKNGKTRSIGMPGSSYDAIRSHDREVVPTLGKTEVIKGVYATGEIPRITDFEPLESSFFRNPECTQQDPIHDDQSLFFDSTEGLVVILGCAHAGVINTLSHIRNLNPGRPFHALIGGMHLLKGDRARIQNTVAILKQLNFKLIAPAHCTGALATAALWTAFEQCVACSTGTQFAFELR